MPDPSIDTQMGTKKKKKKDDDNNGDSAGDQYKDEDEASNEDNLAMPTHLNSLS